MPRTAPDDEASQLAYEFFYWFARFEFALKENKFVRARRDDKGAEADWCQLVKKYQNNYEVSEAAKALLAAPPTFQIVDCDKMLKWEAVGLGRCQSDLAKVVVLLKTVRNNLFHGGKKGTEGWSDKSRIQELLPSGKALLDELAEIAGIESDYTGNY